MSESVAVPDDTKQAILDILKQAASKERAVIEFQTHDGTIHAADITEHVNQLEAMNE